MAGIRLALVLMMAAAVSNGCGGLAELQRLVQPPRVEQAPNRPAEIRFITPSPSNPAGGAGVTLWLQVTNPNPFGVTLSRLETTLLLEGARAAMGDFPLGLPLGAQQTSLVPVDLAVSFADLPVVAQVVRSTNGDDALTYELQGTIGIDAGRLGQPTFGPLRLAGGELALPAIR